MTLTQQRFDTLELDQTAADLPATPPKEVDARVGQNLRNARNLRGLTQKQLGETVGLTLQQIQKYENGSNRITVSRLYQFSEVLNVPVAQFFSGPSLEGNTSYPEETPDDGLKFSADDFEILTLTNGLSARLKRRLICLIEEMSENDRSSASLSS
ncbi:MAG: helix-turn-helix transcriptional regulator [Pseudomonadota bacterium]